nr:hypothetical protein [Alteromonas mediterranea]
MSIQPSITAAPARSLHFAEVLMARESITPVDAGCQSYLMYKLEKLGFVCERHTINGVKNLIAKWGVARYISRLVVILMWYRQALLRNGSRLPSALL